MAHEFNEDVNDGSMCMCGVPATEHWRVDPAPVADPSGNEGGQGRAHRNARERDIIADQIEDLLQWMDEKYDWFNIHPQEFCTINEDGPTIEHRVCSVVNQIQNALMDPEWMGKLKRAAGGPCCRLHASPCCDPDDCGPCCENCPTCPSLR